MQNNSMPFDNTHTILTYITSKTAILILFHRNINGNGIRCFHEKKHVDYRISKGNMFRGSSHIRYVNDELLAPEYLRKNMTFSPSSSN
jgi:hypothetical protein